MDFLTLVQKSMERAGVRSSLPTTLVGAVDITATFVMYVQDSWRELQEESTNWWFRQKLDQTLAVTQSTDEYAMPSGLETINYRTVSLYTTAKTDEAVLSTFRYEDWRMSKDTRSATESRPTHIIERPDGVIQLWPVPDQAYTLRYDGVWDIDELTLDADEPGTTITGGSVLLPERYHNILVYDACIRYFAHHENEEGVREVQSKFLAQRKRLMEKQAPPVYIPAGVLTGLSGYDRSFR
jgi:hypothetical protein